MDVSTLLREHMASANWLLDETMKGVTPDVFRWQPSSGTVQSIADNYLHTVLGADQFLHGTLLNTTPLVTGKFASKSGLSSIPGNAHGSSDWANWIATVEVDLPAFQEYAKAVYSAIDSYLASVKPEELKRPVDLASYGLGVQSLNWSIYNFFMAHAAQHTGEISAIKGMQQLKGYPF